MMFVLVFLITVVGRAVNAGELQFALFCLEVNLYFQNNCRNFINLRLLSVLLACRFISKCLVF